jgi:Uncharacterized conserved protein (COG2071)
MKLPAIEGVIRRRILVNFRVDPEVMRPLVPAPFRIKTVEGYAMAGICLIRLESVRPKSPVGRIGLASENVAYRVAVEWDADGRTQDGVYIPRRDTSSSLQHRLGGRIFPGEYHHSAFEVDDEHGVISIACRSTDGSGDVDLVARETDRFAPGSVFGTLDVASRFFERGAIGYSATTDVGRLDGLLLQSNEWKVAPLEVDHVQSAFFDDPRRFPPGSVVFDNALIMRNIAHEWRAMPELAASA